MRFLECLKSAGKFHHGKQLHLVNDEEVNSISYAKVYVFSDSVFCLGKVNQNPTSNNVWEQQLGWFKDSSQYRTLDTIDGETNGIRVKYLPRIHYIAARPRSPNVHEQNERPRPIPRTNYLHVDVQ